MDKMQKSHSRFGNDRDRVKRVPFGLGQPAGDPAALARCMQCSFGKVPVVEEVVWTIPLPLTESEAQSTFGDIVNVLTSQANVAGVAAIDSTFLLNGILQTDLLTMGIGVHVFCEPMQLSTIGNAWASPATVTSPPISPDVWTVNDITNSCLGASVTTSNYFPADWNWGGETWRAGWNFINGYQFQWKTSQRELVMNELAADVSYFGAFADAEASGTSEFPIAELVASTNAIYRNKALGNIFLPVTFRRVGSVGTSATSNTGIFHATRDFDLSPVTWGGLRWQGYGCKGSMYRQIENPCYLERGIPIGMQFVIQDPVHQAAMLEAITFDNSTLGVNIRPDINVGVQTATGAAVALEQTLDSTPANVPQQVVTTRQVFKGGTLKLAIKLKGWEMPGAWRSWCAQNAPNLVTPGGAPS
jgi:hypothetical protein